MELERLKQEYSFKTDEELLALLADSGSLSDEALPLLTDEIRRRNLSGQPNNEGSLSSPDSTSLARRAWPLRAKWVALWLVNTLNATLGVLIAVGFTIYSLGALVGRAVRLQLMQGPYYPFPIFVAFLAGYFAYRRIRGSYCYWVWILPLVGLVAAMTAWKTSNQASWLDALAYFFGRLPYPENRFQLGTTGILFISLTYSLAALVRGAGRQVDSTTQSDN